MSSYMWLWTPAMFIAKLFNCSLVHRSPLSVSTLVVIAVSKKSSPFLLIILDPESPWSIDMLWKMMYLCRSDEFGVSYCKFGICQTRLTDSMSYAFTYSAIFHLCSRSLIEDIFQKEDLTREVLFPNREHRVVISFSQTHAKNIQRFFCVLWSEVLAGAKAVFVK